MILLWGLKKIPLLLEIPALKDHLSLARLLALLQRRDRLRRGIFLKWVEPETPPCQ